MTKNGLWYPDNNPYKNLNCHQTIDVAINQIETQDNMLFKEQRKTNFLSLNETAKAYGFSRHFLYQLKDQGKLKFYYINTKPFIKIDEFESLFKPE